jgi:hypothetical protein
MDKHLSEIELFELANNLVTDLAQLKTIEEHISICESCSAKLENEKSINGLLASNLQVNEKVDVSENIMNHFSPVPVTPVSDNNWIIYIILGLFGFLTVLQMMDFSMLDSIYKINVPQIPYIYVITSAVVSILFMDLLFKYFKQKKQVITA